MPKNLGAFWKIPNTQKQIRVVWEFVPDNFGQIIKVGKKFYPPFQVLSLTWKTISVGKNNFRSSCEHEGICFLSFFWSRTPDPTSQGVVGTPKSSALAEGW
jgi:hypothetical protein